MTLKNGHPEKPLVGARKLNAQAVVFVGLGAIGLVGGVVLGVLLGVTFATDPDSGGVDGTSIWDYVIWIAWWVALFGTVGAVLGAIAGGIVWLLWLLWVSARQRFASRFAKRS